MFEFRSRSISTQSRRSSNATEGFSASYLDDIVIYSVSWDDHLTHIQQVLERLRERGLTAKPSKCKFGIAECNYLGHVVGRGVVRPDPTKLEAVDNFPIPKMKQQLRHFLGLTGYYRRFIQDYASIASPLTDLTRKTEPQQLRWSSKCQVSFQQLKQCLCQAPVLKSPDFERTFILKTDASNRGVGAVLTQKEMVEESTQLRSTVGSYCPVSKATQRWSRNV